MSQSKLIYLSAPYSHPLTVVREFRVNEINKYARTIIKQGLFVFSPITHNHPINLVAGVPLGWKLWKPFDTYMLSLCYKMHVLLLPEWENSIGVTHEITAATVLSIPIEYVDPDTYEITNPARS